MKNSKFAKFFRQLFADMKDMTFGEKVEHIWINFKEYIIVFAICTFAVSAFLYSVLKTEKEVLISGMLININISEEGLEYVSSDYFEHLGGNKKTQEANVISTYFQLTGDKEDLEYSYSVYERVTTMAIDGSLDFLITDELALKSFIQEEIYVDLNEIFSEQELAQFAAEDRITYAQPEDGEKYPVAINLQGTPFAEKYLQDNDDYYISFITTSPRLSLCYSYWEYLLAVDQA